jgi:pimeloyl-ACP methyl ester carboxylesterase
MVDLGSGCPIVLVPGIQGRWEWMRPAVEALARRCRVLTSSLPGDPGSGAVMDPARGFGSLVDHVERLRADARVDRLAVCGVSYGGLVALAYAAAHPERTLALVLVSTPGPDWQPDARVRRYVRWPRLLAPLFVATAPFRLGPEIAAAYDAWLPRLRFVARHLARVLAAPMSPSRMSGRVRLAAGLDVRAACAAVRAPTLVVTGEPGLDRVVPVERTLEYARAIRGARTAVLERTGHIGLVTRPERFADLVGGFVAAVAAGEDAPALAMPAPAARAQALEGGRRGARVETA